MILRRITEHVKAQNWFAVGLDFLIVVLGVFLGLQVNNWNEARAASRQEVVLIAQLADDLRSMRDSFVFADAISQRTHDGWVAIFRALESCRPIAADPQLVQYALARYQRTSQVNVQRTAYDELTSLGMFSRLSNRELKDDVARLYALIEADNQGALGRRAGSCGGPSPFLLRAIRLRALIGTLESSTHGFAPSLIPSTIARTWSFAAPSGRWST